MVARSKGMLVSLFLISLSLSIFPGCKKHESVNGSAPVNEKVRITLDWKSEPEFGGFYQADISGGFKSRVLNVELKAGGEGAPTWQLVGEGQTEFATTAADQVIIARTRGADVVAVFAVFQTAPQGIMVHKARGFTSIQDVFTHDGTLAVEDNAWVKFLLNKFGTPTVKLTGYTGGIALFLAKPDFSQQCFVTSEPLLARRQGGDPQTFLVADAGYNPYTTVLITRGDRIKQHPEQVKAMVESCREGWRKYLDDPAAANAHMLALNKEMDPESAAAQKPLIETDETKANGLGSMTLDRWKTLAQQLVDLKVIEKAPPAEDCFAKF